MKNFSELFEGGTPKMQKKRRTAFYCVCITAALIAAMLLFLVIFSISSAIADNAKKQEELKEENISISTSAGSIEESVLHEGKLLLLDGEHPLQSKPTVILISSRERPKTDAGDNAYTIGWKSQNDESKLGGTAEAVDALNKMIEAFYKSSKDDNIFVEDAHNNTKLDSQEALFATGTAFELGYFSNPDNYGERSGIAGVDKYKWIYNNAYKYGFILADDPTAGEAGSDTFRFVGVAHATAMRALKVSTLEEYMEQLKSATADAPIAVKVNNKTTYAVYYLAAGGEYMLPTEYQYEVEGNNTDGYVVTVNLLKK